MRPSVDKWRCEWTKVRKALKRSALAQRYGMATAAARAPAWAICAMATMFFQVLPLPKTAFSGTTIVSPGSRIAVKAPPDQSALPRLTTSPFARRMKMVFLLPMGVAPPARDRYQAALFLREEVIALELYTCPTTHTNPGCL